MSASYSIQSSQKLVRVILSGNTTLDEIITMLSEIVHDHRYIIGFNFLFDVRTISQYLSYSETISLFEHYQKHLNGTIKGKMGILITKVVQFGVTRIASTIFSAKGIDVDAFYTEEKALEWLNSAGP